MSLGSFGRPWGPAVGDLRVLEIFRVLRVLAWGPWSPWCPWGAFGVLGCLWCPWGPWGVLGVLRVLVECFGARVFFGVFKFLVVLGAIAILKVLEVLGVPGVLWNRLGFLGSLGFFWCAWAPLGVFEAFEILRLRLGSLGSLGSLVSWGPWGPSGPWKSLWGLCGPWGPSLQSFEVLKILGGLEVVFGALCGVWTPWVLGFLGGPWGSLSPEGPWGVWTWSRALGSLRSLWPLGTSSGLREASSGRGCQLQSFPFEKLSRCLWEFSGSLLTLGAKTLALLVLKAPGQLRVLGLLWSPWCPLGSFGVL